MNNTQKTMPEHRRKVFRRLASLAYCLVEELKNTYGITFKQIAQELDMDYDNLMIFRKAKTNGFTYKEKTVMFKNFTNEFEMDIKEIRSMANYLDLRVKLLRKQDELLEEWKEL